MNVNPAIESYWQQYLDTLPTAHAHRSLGYTAWGFGDTPELRDELGQLVKQGVKTATASLAWEYEDKTVMPAVGEISITLDGQEQPLSIIETTEIRIAPFNEVDAQFAYDEGEGDRTIDYWRNAHQNYFARVCQRIGRVPSETMPVVFERFRVIFDA